MMKSLAPNTLLQNRYLIVHLIGKGGMGDVYLAVDQRLGSAVALKRTFFADDEMLGNAFEREAKTLARLRHPVLPKVSDHFTENEEQYLVMEHISGDDLSKRLEAAQKPFPLSWVLFWADQLLDALAYLHAHEPPIIHRDIKPQNLKLTDENSIILLDFGLSKNNAGETKAVSTGTGSTGSIVGYTPHYAPMEQIRGTGTNPRSDIYALSATLYQLMTNIVPADALTRADALLNDMPDPIKPINQLNPEVSPAVSSVIIKGMEISQDRRFSTAREMQKALRDAFANMQNAMTAQTVAFNLQQDQNLAQGKPIPPSQEKTEVLNIPPGEIMPVAAPPSTPLVSHPSVPPPGNSGISQGQNLDATLRMDSPLENSLPKQSDVKTEVFLAGTTPEIAAVQAENNFARNNSGQEQSFSNGENFGNNTSKSNSQGFAPDATVPLFNYEGEENPTTSEVQPADSMFFTNAQLGDKTDAFATFTPTREYTPDSSAGAGQFDSQPRAEEVRPSAAPTSAPKKSSGKMLAVVGGLGALLILTIVAAGGGWFVYKNYYAATVTESPSPSPSAEPSLEITPSPAPSLETVFDTNTNSDAGNSAVNSNSEVVTTNTNTQSVESANRPTPIPADTRQTAPTPPRTATPRPAQQRTPSPVKPSQTPAKPTPKPGKLPIIVQ